MGAGIDKALLEVDGRTLLARTIETLARITEDIQVVGRSSLPAGCRPVQLTEDVVAGAGPLGGLHAGLLRAHHDSVIAVACDYPFLSEDVLRLLLHHQSGHQAAVPYAGGKLHFTQAVFSRAILPVVEQHLAAGRYRLRDLLDALQARRLEEEELRAVDLELGSLINVNTPEDWERALGLLHGAPPGP